MSHPNREMATFLIVGLHPCALIKQKREQGGYSTFFVTVLERIVFDHEAEEDAGVSNQCWVQSLAQEHLKQDQSATLTTAMKKKHGIFILNRDLFSTESTPRDRDFVWAPWKGAKGVPSDHEVFGGMEYWSRIGGRVLKVRKPSLSLFPVYFFRAYPL